MRLVVSAPGLPEASERPRTAASRTVLIALENDCEREWMAATVRHQGFNVLTAKHAGHALLVMFRNVQAIDVLVTHAELSDMTGAELSDKIRSHCPYLDAIFVPRPFRSDVVLSRLKELF